MTQVWSGFHALTADECRRLLATERIGRLAVTVGALPLVLPVQYEVVDTRVLLRTPGHHELGTSIDGQVVGFEIDHLDLDHGAGWCVAVTGTARVVTDHGAASAPMHRWFSDGVVLALDTDVITGHRIAV
jgi:hypothetical protein